MPGGDKNIKPEDGKQFSSDYQPANPGRKKKLVSSVLSQLKEEGYEEVTAPQVVEMIGFMLNLDKARMQELADDTDQPVYIQHTAKRLCAATDKDLSEFIDKQLDRAHGKAKQGVDVTSGGKELNPMAGLPIEKQAEILRMLKDGNNG